jgi:hypothetical protein
MIGTALRVYGAVACVAALAAQTKPLISENFESGKIDPKVWELRITGTVEIKVVQESSAHGKYALQVHYPVDAVRIPQGAPNAGPAYGYLVAKNIPEAARKHLFGRAYLKVTELPPAHTQIFFADLSGFPVSRYQEIGLNFPRPANPGDIPKPMWLANYQEMVAKTRQEGRGEDVWRGEADPYNKWMLVEWEFSDDPSYTRLWIDGQPVTMSQKDQKGEMAQFHWPAGSETNRNLVGGYQEVGFGARPWGQVAKDFDVLLDDIVIDTKRIGPAK